MTLHTSSIELSMANIKVLEPEVRDAIAAGEVITRPASVVKELLENSLDAQAQRIDVDIADGGKKKCLVNDDGVGMSKEDALLSIERYGTSKIQNIDDIQHITTYGFRGEALASIAQVSQLELETADGTRGTRITVTAGKVRRVVDSRRPRGTQVKVSNLFFNLPARLKFLKSAQWERRLITEMVKSYAFINPSVHMTVSESGRNIVDLASAATIAKRLRLALPRTLTESLVEINVDVGTVKLSGFVSRPDVQERYRFQHLYVNSRPVRYPRLYRAVIRAYQEPQFPPAFLLNIVVEPDRLDVNIHPTKNEVKLRDEHYVVDLLMQAIKKKAFSVAATHAYEDMTVKTQKDSQPQQQYFVQEHLVAHEPAPQPHLDREDDAGEFWQLHDTYILTQTRSGLIIVDQHVAHERIIYESVMTGAGGAQRLLFPITLNLSPEEYQTYKKTKSLLRELGVEFKEFSSRTVVIDSLPTDAHVSREGITQLFRDLDELGSVMKEKSEVAKVIACHSAIKAGQKLSVMEMRSLIDRLFACENPYTCPHGRPIVLKFTLDDLASKFGRT